MTEEEIRLVARLTADVQETGARFRRQAVIIMFGAVVVAAIAAVQQAWGLMAFVLLFGGGLFWIGRRAASGNSPERAAPVLLALRDAPERVKTISHMVTSDSKRIFVSHWVTVKTDDGHLHVKAQDWEQLIGKLEQRCPNATVKR